MFILLGFHFYKVFTKKSKTKQAGKWIVHEVLATAVKYEELSSDSQYPCKGHAQ